MRHREFNLPKESQLAGNHNAKTASHNYPKPAHRLWVESPSSGMSLGPPTIRMGFPGGSVVKNLPPKAGNSGLIPGLGWSPREGKSNPLQYSCLGSPKNRGDWRATVQRVAKSRIWLSEYTTMSNITSHSWEGGGDFGLTVGSPLKITHGYQFGWRET